MRTVIAALDSITESMVNVYAKRTKLAREEIWSLMSAETWFSPQQAVEKGFADEMRGVIKTAAIAGTKRVFFNGIEHDLSRFHNVPAFENATTIKTNMPKATKPKANAEESDENGEKETPTPKPETPTPPKPPEPEPGGPPREPPAAETDFDRGVQAERTRVIALQKLDRPATHAIVAAAIKDGKQVVDITEDVINAMEKASTQAARRADASSLNGIPGSDVGVEPATTNLGELLTKSVKARLKQRGLNNRLQRK
jgi:hypothetical protein